MHGAKEKIISQLVAHQTPVVQPEIRQY